MRTDVSRELTSTLIFSILAILFCTIPISAHYRDTIVAVYGSTPTINGLIEVGEWHDASTVIVSVTEDANCTVYAKQDGTNLYVGFNISDVTYNSSDCCVVIFDVNHDGSTSLQADDIWLRVCRNGAKGELNITAGGWYPTTVSGWTAKTSSTAGAWQSEYNITYSKLDVNAGTNKTLGVMFLIVDRDVEMGWYVWPATAGILEPATWGDMTSNGYNWVPEFSTWTSLLVLLVVLTFAIAMCRFRLVEALLHKTI